VRENEVTARIVEMTPKRRLERERAHPGRAAVVQGCVDLLRGAEVDDDFIVVLGGEHGVSILEGRDSYWPSVWAVRGLLHVWDDDATTEAVRAMAHSSWRVRKMAAKVVARHHVDDALETVVHLRRDPVLRVRAAADRAVIALTGV
jgi:hypothetical protein